MCCICLDACWVFSLKVSFVFVMFCGCGFAHFVVVVFLVVSVPTCLMLVAADQPCRTVPVLSFLSGNFSIANFALFSSSYCSSWFLGAWPHFSDRQVVGTQIWGRESQPWARNVYSWQFLQRWGVSCKIIFLMGSDGIQSFVSQVPTI